MAPDENPTIRTRIERIRRLCGHDQSSTEYFEAASLAQSVLHDTIGGSHPIMSALDGALKSADWSRAWPLAAESWRYAKKALSRAHVWRLPVRSRVTSLISLRRKSRRPRPVGTARRSSCNLRSRLFFRAPLSRTHCDAWRMLMVLHTTPSEPPYPNCRQPCSNHRNRLRSFLHPRTSRSLPGATRGTKADHGRFSEIAYTEAVAMGPGCEGIYRAAPSGVSDPPALVGRSVT